MVLQDNLVTHIEIVLENFARIRDIETGIDGNVYLLLEHESGGQIVRLVPDDSVNREQDLAFHQQENLL